MKRTKKRKILPPTLAVLLATLLIAVMPTEAECAVYEDTVRLHILANSNSTEDQELKLEIRDCVLEKFGTRLSQFESSDGAISELRQLIPQIESFAESETRKRGYSYSVKAELCEEWYDTREYEDFTLPCGYYTSLKILIGEGVGNNWWCVMFPPLCLNVACEQSPFDDAIKKYSDEEISLITTKRYNPKFKILELVSGLFAN